MQWDIVNCSRVIPCGCGHEYGMAYAGTGLWQVNLRQAITK